ncbi:MAG: phospholipid carrier-dependent glycosyltransferase, partial [Gemmiger sp.]|nr:phospholipid carrier-dependent glycosyltransferase [Gemmiger sp.]
MNNTLEQHPLAVLKDKRLQRILLAALLARLVLAYVTEGYAYDMSCFVAWGEKLLNEGAAAFYSDGYFADYPPGYILVLGLVAFLRKIFSIPYEAPATYLLLAVVPTLCDCATTALVWFLGQRYIKNEGAVWRLTVFTAFCPVLLYDTAIWKQIDGAFSLPILLCFWLLEEKRYLPACVCYGIALAIKPQALLAGPVLALCFVAAVADAATPTQRLRAVGRAFGGAGLALAPVLVAGLPFYGFKNLIPALVEKYIATTSGYLYATINAFNWLALLGGNWKGQDELVFGPVSWKMLGMLNLLLLTAALVALGVLSWRKKRFSPLLLAAFYILGVYTFAHCMHERYMVFGALLVLLAAARWNDKRLLGAGFGFSVTGLVNLAAVYSLVGGEDEWLTSATSASFARVIGLAETLCFCLLAWALWDIVAHGRVVPLAAGECQPAGAPGQTAGGPQPVALPPLGKKKRKLRAENALPTQPPSVEGQPVWHRREKLALLGLTAATALLSFFYLGDFSAPHTTLDAADTTLAEPFALAGDTVPASLWVYPGAPEGHESGSLTITDDATGAVVATLTLDYSNVFCWTRTDFTPASLGGAGQYTATVTGGRVVELSLRDAAGQPVAVRGGGALLDEQALVPATFSQLNSMYFDEIYHGRTGYEMLHKLTVFETTHPPLGKDFILLGIAIFGMTGFGWRFAGTLFGVLLVPLLYLFVRRLTRKPWVAGVAGVLLALDFMRFTQSRIATIDTCSTFFILLGGYCLLWYAQTALRKGIDHALLPMALGGVAFGLGAASKWTGLYAGAGLAILYFGVLYARWRQKKPGFMRELRTALLGGVLFYVAVPFVIYLAAYLPYYWRDPSFGLKQWWDCQVYMFDYHATLNATHPFESYWYTWALLLRPVWYYMNGNLAAGSYASIAGMGGPVVWL